MFDHHCLQMKLLTSLIKINKLKRKECLLYYFRNVAARNNIIIYRQNVGILFDDFKLPKKRNDRRHDAETIRYYY